ncbi:helix-turn-helix domain-containing protein [Paenibacillus naphthalenovorans]|uniref:helix-turn-helix domain-containing protein n=1 Tax=Paenibacillus naphthalenovorans TaxID=162209 RepID=UPI003D2E5369
MLFLISYKPLLETLKGSGISPTELVRVLKLRTGFLTTIKEGDYVNLSTIEKICLYLEVPIEKVVEIIPDKK